MFLNILTNATLKGTQLHLTAQAEAPQGGYRLAYNVDIQGGTLFVVVTASGPEPDAPTPTPQTGTTILLDETFDVPSGTKRVVVMAVTALDL